MTEDGELRMLALQHAAMPGLPHEKVLEAAVAYYAFLTARVEEKAAEQ